ncbi:MAG TPA: hypothetical protein VFN10_23800 [Thermoanaerobaculia bacterium]|nr:hypothetical protein [Thermoanaerobaculia bacterium]
MSRIAKFSSIAVAITLLVATAVVVVNHISYARWAQRVISLQQALEASGGKPVVLPVQPQEMRVGRNGEVSMRFKPPFSSWPWYAAREPFGDASYVITISSRDGQPTRVTIDHGLE